ncbi:hypothetical protein BJX70DRAFT_399101 [Aspergillus crustosus]
MADLRDPTGSGYSLSQTHLVSADALPILLFNLSIPQPRPLLSLVAAAGHMVAALFIWTLFGGTPVWSMMPTSNGTGFPPYDALIAAGLGDHVALNSRHRPWCFFLPRNTTEVSVGLVAMLEHTKEFKEGAGDWTIAVRSAGYNMGHTNNVEYGVTIDLFYLNQTAYNPATNIASVSPGSRWQEV